MTCQDCRHYFESTLYGKCCALGYQLPIYGPDLEILGYRPLYFYGGAECCKGFLEKELQCTSLPV